MYVYVSVCAQHPEASASLRQPPIADRTQRQHCVFNLFLPAGRSSRLETSLVEKVGWLGGRVVLLEEDKEEEEGQHFL